MPKIIVTGGAGFIGSNIVDKFIELGHQVCVIDDLSTGFLENLNPKAKFYLMDIRSKKIEQIFKKEKPEILCHYAAQIDLRRSMEEPVADGEINIIGTLNLLSFCVKHHTKKIIYASTAGVYGEQMAFPADEDHPLNPVSPYGITKLTTEKYLSFFKDYYGLNFISLRYSNVYGPRQRPKGEAGVVAIFCERLLNKKKAIINGEGKQTRDFVFVEDVVWANLLALKYPKSDIFNIGTGKETDINKLFSLIKDESKSKQKEIHGSEVKGEQKRSVLDFSKAKKLLGWEPKYDLIKGIEKTIEFYRKR